MAGSKPRMPKGFKSEGQKLWRTVLDQFDLDHEPHKVEVLHACRVSDTIAELQRATANEPLRCAAALDRCSSTR